MNGIVVTICFQLENYAKFDSMQFPIQYRMGFWFNVYCAVWINTYWTVYFILLLLLLFLFMHTLVQCVRHQLRWWLAHLLAYCKSISLIGSVAYNVFQAKGATASTLRVVVFVRWTKRCACARVVCYFFFAVGSGE